MYQHDPGIRAVPDVCEVEVVGGAGADRGRAPELLIEVPHGATGRRHFDAVRARLRGSYPDDLESFFFVNTDAGAPECARKVAELVAAPATGGGGASASVLLVRCLVPRTFIDCNRAVDVSTEEYREARFTPALPEYVTDPADTATLDGMYRAYRDVTREAYERVCGNGGLALILHTYAPKAVGIHRIDGNIVRKLREAYRPEVYATWENRPDVDLITEDENGARLAPDGLVGAIREGYAAIGIQAAENASYRLHASTMGYRHSARYPGRVLCMEISRALLADPFVPFEEMRIGPDKAATMAEPIARALRGAAGGTC